MTLTRTSITGNHCCLCSGVMRFLPRGNLPIEKKLYIRKLFVYLFIGLFVCLFVLLTELGVERSSLSLHVNDL